MGLDSAQYLYPSNTSVAWKYTSSYGLDNQIDTDGYFYLAYTSVRSRKLSKHLFAASYSPMAKKLKPTRQ